MTRYFPEVVEAVKENFPERCVIDGEIIVADVEGPAGLRGAAAADPSRRQPGQAALPADAGQFVAFDLLALDDEDLHRAPFSVRRATLEQALAGHGRRST